MVVYPTLFHSTLLHLHIQHSIPTYQNPNFFTVWSWIFHNQQ